MTLDSCGEPVGKKSQLIQGINIDIYVVPCCAVGV